MNVSRKSKTCMIVSLSLLSICIILIAMPVVIKEQAMNGERNVSIEIRSSL